MAKLRNFCESLARFLAIALQNNPARGAIILEFA
jgi:hypothetical protein